MAWQESVRRWLRRERDEAAEIKARTEERLDAELSRREAELEATPEQRIESLREEMAANDAAIEAIRQRNRSQPPAPDA